MVWREQREWCRRGTAGIAGPGRGKKGQPKNRITALKSGLPAVDPGDVTAHRWRKRLCIKSEDGIEVDDKGLQAAAEETVQRCINSTEMQSKGTERGTAGTGDFQRYTPAKEVEAAREVLGTIDLDPASNPQAQETVKAEKFFTEDDDGLSKEWDGNVWLNPPYHRALQACFR